MTLKVDLLFPSCETFGSVINFLGLRCSCGQDTMMPQGRRNLIPDSICKPNMQIDRVEKRWLECLLCHLSFYGTWLSSCHIQEHSQSRLKGGSGQFAEFLHPRTVTTLALFCAHIAVNSLVVIGREVSTSPWQKMRLSTNGLGWCWQTEVLLCPSKLPGLPQLVLVTPDSCGLSSVAGDDCWLPPPPAGSNVNNGDTATFYSHIYAEVQHHLEENGKKFYYCFSSAFTSTPNTGATLSPWPLESHPEYLQQYRNFFLHFSLLWENTWGLVQTGGFGECKFKQ